MGSTPYYCVQILTFALLSGQKRTYVETVIDRLNIAEADMSVELWSRINYFKSSKHSCDMIGPALG